MEINATLKDGAYTLLLEGAPPNCVVELRLQNTMNGSHEAQTLTANASGTALIGTPINFGGHFSISSRLLTQSNDLQVHEFKLEKVGPNDDSLRYTQSTQAVATSTPTRPEAARPSIHESEV